MNAVKEIRIELTEWRDIVKMARAEGGEFPGVVRERVAKDPGFSGRVLAAWEALRAAVYANDCDAAQAAVERLEGLLDRARLLVIERRGHGYIATIKTGNLGYIANGAPNGARIGLTQADAVLAAVKLALVWGGGATLVVEAPPAFLRAFGRALDIAKGARR